MAHIFMTAEQVELLEQLDDFVEWVECFGSIGSGDVAYMRQLVDNLADSVSKSEGKNELAEECPFLEGDNEQGAC